MSLPDSTAYCDDVHTTYFQMTDVGVPAVPDRYDLTCSVYVLADGRLTMYVQPCKPSHSTDLHKQRHQNELTTTPKRAARRVNRLHKPRPATHAKLSQLRQGVGTGAPGQNTPN